MFDNLISIASGILVYLFLEYIWRPYLKPKFDRRFLNKSQNYLHRDIQTLYNMLNQDWADQHILPNVSAYNNIYKQIKSRLNEYVSKRECDNLELVIHKLNQMIHEKPKPVEITTANNFIHSTILVMLARIASQVPPYTKII